MWRGEAYERIAQPAPVLTIKAKGIFCYFEVTQF
jgi:hypothetical protein